MEKKREAEQRAREAQERELRKREKAEEKERRRREYDAQRAAKQEVEKKTKKETAQTRSKWYPLSSGKVHFNVCLVEKSEQEHCLRTASCLTCTVDLIVPDLHLCSLGAERPGVGEAAQQQSLQKPYRQAAVGK